MRVAEDRAADRPRRARPGFEAGAAVSDRPAHQAVDRHRGVGPDCARRRPACTSPPRGRITSPRTPRVGDQHVRSAAEHRRPARRASRASFSAATISSLLRVSTSQSAGPPTRNVVSGASGTFAPHALRRRMPACAARRRSPSRAPRLDGHQRALLRDQRRHRLAPACRPRTKSCRPAPSCPATAMSAVMTVAIFG